MKTIFVLLSVINVFLCAKLLGVVEFFRHGARGPLIQDPLDPHEWTKDEVGLLTAAGMRMHFLLGHELRNRYVKTNQWDNDPNHILPEHFKDINLEVHSDNFERCILSAQSQLTGLYPPGTGPVLENEVQMKTQPPYHVSDLKEIQQELKYQALPFLVDPVPVHVYQIDNFIVNADEECDRVQLIQQKFAETEEYKNWIQTNFIDSGIQAELQKVFPKSGQIDWQEAKRIYDWAQVDKAEGYPLPEEFTDELYWKLYDLNSFLFFMERIPTNESVALETSGFWKDTMQFFDDLLAGKTEKKMKLWSSHDTGVAPVVKSLQLEPYNITSAAPPFASNVLIELYQNNYDKDGYAIFKYQDIVRKSAFCKDVKCSYAEFKNLTSMYIYDDIESACKVTFFEKIDQYQTLTFGSAGIAFFVLAALITKKLL